MKVLTLVRGCPGAGKTTFAESIFGKENVYSADTFFEDLNGNYHFNPSEIRDAHRWCQQMVNQRMITDTENETSVIAVANTFTQQWEFEYYVTLAKEFGYMVHSIIVENRHGNSNVHDVPDSKVEEMRNRFEVKF
jgi:predicted kinase